MRRTEHDLPLGWRTELAVLVQDGALVEDHGDHRVVRSPQNPTYHWGNFVLVTDPVATADVRRWEERFTEVFPGATYRAIGLATGTGSATDWDAAGIEVVRDPVLVAREPWAAAEPPAGYVLRRLELSADGDASSALREAAYPGLPEFTRWVTDQRADRAGDGLAWFGAFAAADGVLAAELGIADCAAGVARFQGVVTHPGHRRRGLAGALLAAADAHARRAYGAATTVIIADQDSPAARLYRSLGMTEVEPKVKAYRLA